MKRSWRRGLTVVMAIGLVGALAGCSGQSGANPSSVKTPKGSTVDVWSIYPGNAGSDQIGAGVKAGIRAINASGGLAGHLVVVKECKDELTPQSEIQCTQQAAQDPIAIAEVSPLIITAEDATNAISQKALLPNIASAPDDEAALNSSMQYPLGQNLFDTPGCAALAAKEVKATSIAFAYTQTPNAILQTTNAAKIATAAGIKNKTITFPLTTTDVSPFVQQAVSSKADLIIPSAPPNLMGSWLTTEGRDGYTGATCTSDGLVTYQSLVGLGANATKVYLTGSYPEVTWDYPILERFKKEAAAEVAAGDALASTSPANNPNLVLRGWMGTWALRQAAKNLSGDTLTKKTLVEALDKTTVTFGDGGKSPLPDIDFSKPGPIPGFPRQFNTGTILKKWNPATKTVDPVGSGQPAAGEKL